MTSVNRAADPTFSRSSTTAAHGVHASGDVTGLAATAGALLLAIVSSCALAAQAFGHAWLGLLPVAAVLLVVAPVGGALVRQYPPPDAKLGAR
ncbi:MAG TPA: hypothetical protein VIA18_23175 [Polyangia bacterium]|jgi:hypothetical protein|nr:hypothetical protein [Polyangia bacterium]